MSRELTLKDLKNIVYASVLFGGGGGGSSIEGLELIEAMKKDGFTEHSMVSLEEMEAEENGKPVVSTMVAALGSPTATKGQTFIDESKNAIVAMKEAAEGPMKGILEFTDEEVTSIDFLAYPHTSVFDSVQSLELSDHLFKIVGYYDNEFGYSNKLLELAKHMNKVDNE